MYKNFHAKLLGEAHRFLFERQSLNNLFTKLAVGAYRILLSRGNHQNPNIHTKLAGGAEQPLSPRALETINTRFSPEEWLHIYTDGSLLDFAQGAGIGVFSHLFSFYLHAGPLTTHFDAFCVARDKPWSTLCKKSHGIPSSPRAAAVAKFRLLTGHDCHLFRFNLVTSPICVLCDTGQDMTAAHLDECSALNDLNCIVKRYWRARCLMT
ncbi:uncharacterized protein TNCV_2888351 [Trichonephila clavipes]|nr:uncharacterized protein TNCV_2888351 [Trichonephila clavipes]